MPLILNMLKRSLKLLGGSLGGFIGNGEPPPPPPPCVRACPSLIFLQGSQIGQGGEVLQNWTARIADRDGSSVHGKTTWNENEPFSTAERSERVENGC